MRYVFFGTPEFAAIILDKLIKAGFIPQAVICNPDRPVGRKKILTSPPAKVLAQKYNIPVWQPETLLKSQSPAINGASENSSAVRGPRIGTLDISLVNKKNLSSRDVDNSLSEPAEGFAPSESRVPILDPHYAAGSQDILYQDWDLFIVAAYAKILPKDILDIPRLGSIGVHPSILPKYRGPTPIQSVILAGEEKTGVTLFLMDEKVDHGPILAKSEIQISKSETYESLHNKLAELGADLLIKLLPLMEAPRLFQPQDESKATYTKKFSTEDAYVEPADLEKAQTEGGTIAIQIERKIRALNPEPGVWSIKDGKRMKIIEGTIMHDSKLKLQKIQFEGGKPISLG